MDSLISRRMALFGSNRTVLTLGLMMARRDLRLQGICPGAAEACGKSSDPSSDSNSDIVIPYEASLVLHGTLLLGCPVYADPAELAGQSDVLWAAEGLSDMLSDISSKPVVTVSEGTAESDRAEASSIFAAFVRRQGKESVLRFSCADVRILSDMRQLWESLQPSGLRASDAGLLSWEQAADLAERLFAENLTA